MEAIFIAILTFIIAALLFRALDRWHRRKAWRDAGREASEYMRRYHK